MNGEGTRARGPTDRARGLDVGIGRRYSFGIRGRRTSRGGWVRRRTSATVASTSRVSEVVMVWRTMGCSEPSLTLPTVTVLRMEGERKGGSGQTAIQQLRVRCRGRGKKRWGDSRAESRSHERGGPFSTRRTWWDGGWSGGGTRSKGPWEGAPWGRPRRPPPRFCSRWRQRGRASRAWREPASYPSTPWARGREAEMRGQNRGPP